MLLNYRSNWSVRCMQSLSQGRLLGTYSIGNGNRMLQSLSKIFLCGVLNTNWEYTIQVESHHYSLTSGQFSHRDRGWLPFARYHSLCSAFDNVNSVTSPLLNSCWFMELITATRQQMESLEYFCKRHKAWICPLWRIVMGSSYNLRSFIGTLSRVCQKKEGKRCFFRRNVSFDEHEYASCESAMVVIK